MKCNQAGFIGIAIILVIALALGIGGTYYTLHPNHKLETDATSTSVINNKISNSDNENGTSSIKVEVSSVSPTTMQVKPDNKAADSPIPRIDSSSPYNGSYGSTIQIHGSGFAGFEGDIYFFFERPDGKIARLPGTLTYNVAGSQTATVLLKEPCEEGQTVYGDYSGVAAKCNYVRLTTGIYKIYTEPWGKRSNIFKLGILNEKADAEAKTQLASNPLKITSPNGGEAITRTPASMITFNAGNYVGKTVRVFLVNEETDQSWEVSGTDSTTAGSQSLYLLVPSAAPSGSKYKIGIGVCESTPGGAGCSYRRGDYADTSDGYFSIVEKN